MNLQQTKILLLVVVAFSALIVFSPALQRLVVFPKPETFTELWLLGPEHVAENYPRNITSGSSYTVFLGLANHLDQAAYYSIQIKFRNQSQSAPNDFDRTPSSLDPLYSVNVFLADNASWELPIAFSFDYIFDNAASKVDFSSLKFNNVALNLNGYSTLRDLDKGIFFGDLIIEVWLYNNTIDSFQYHERYVDLKLNFEA